jgi:hypothetical protein
MPIGPVQLDAHRAIPLQRLLMGVSESVSVAGGDNGDRRADLLEEREAAAGPAAVVGDLQHLSRQVGPLLEQPALRLLFDIAWKQDPDVPIPEQED